MNTDNRRGRGLNYGWARKDEGLIFFGGGTLSVLSPPRRCDTRARARARNRERNRDVFNADGGERVIWRR